MILKTDNFIEQDILNKSKFFLIYLNLFLSFVQVSISSFKTETFLIVVIINLSTILTYNIVFKKENLIHNLVGSLMVVAINIFYLSGPLIIKTILFQEITSNLNLPMKSFIIAFFFQIIAILAFIITNNSKNDTQDTDYNKTILFRLKVFNYFDLKSTLKLFLILLFIKLYLNTIDQGLGAFTEFSNMAMKFLYGIEKFYYLPILFYFNLYFYHKKVTKKKFTIFLLINSLLFILFGLLSNTRSEILIGFFMITLNFLIIFIFSADKNYKKNIKYFFIFIVFFGVIFQTLSQIVLEKRAIQSEVTAIDLLKYSIGVYNFEKDDINISTEYDAEDYTGNSVFNRFTAIKYLDKTLFESSFLSTSQINDFKKFSLMRMLAVFPENLINKFNKQYKKEAYFIATGSYIEQKSGFRFGGKMSAGSFLTEIILLTNSYLLSAIILFFIFFLIFNIIIKFQIKDKNTITYSPLLILLTYDLIFFVNSDSLLSFINLSIRTTLQYVLIYYLLNIIINREQNINLKK